MPPDPVNAQALVVAAERWHVEQAAIRARAYESEIKHRNMRISEAVRSESERWRKALYALVQRGAIRPAVADELDEAVDGMRTIRSRGQAENPKTG